MSYLDALIRERENLKTRGLSARVAQVDAEIKRVSGLVVDDSPAEVETADMSPDAETATVRRGPGRPRKPTA